MEKQGNLPKGNRQETEEQIKNKEIQQKPNSLMSSVQSIFWQ